VLLAVLTASAVADLATIPFPRQTVPPLPAGYAFVKQRDPHAAILEIPLVNCAGPNLDAVTTYWQALHRLTTSAGGAGHVNIPQVNLIGLNSPFLASRLAERDYLDDGGKLNFNLNIHVDFKDYVWLYLTANRFDYILLHRGPEAMPGFPGCLDRLDDLLREAKVYEDASTVVYERALLKPPTHPVHFNLGQWRSRNVWRGRWNSVIPETARIAVYNPDPAQSLTLVMDMAALDRARTVRISAGGTELVQWTINAYTYHHIVSKPFHLPAGLQELTIENRATGRYARRRRKSTADQAVSAADQPVTARVARVSLYTDPETESIAIQDRKDAPATETTVR
jgi:hypothetical protein